MREGLQWKAHSHEARVARTWNGKPTPLQRGTPKKIMHNQTLTFLNKPQHNSKKSKQEIIARAPATFLALFYLLNNAAL